MSVMKQNIRKVFFSNNFIMSRKDGNLMAKDSENTEDDELFSILSPQYFPFVIHEYLSYIIIDCHHFLKKVVIGFVSTPILKMPSSTNISLSSSIHEPVKKIGMV